MKRGIKTTEFWIALLVIVGNLLAALASALPPKWAAVCVAAVAIAYKLSRGLTKMGGAEAFGALAASESTADPHAVK